LSVPSLTAGLQEPLNNYRRLALTHVCETTTISRCASYEQVMWGDVYHDRHSNHEYQDESANDSRHFRTTHFKEKQNEYGDEENSDGDGGSNDACRYIKSAS
jgi:hypothetical protein